MRKHGWQLPYHPLQIVAVAVFLALGFAFYVFFAPFVGKQLFQYIAMGIYTPLIVCAFGLYVWCAASDPADLGVFRSKKYLNIPENENHAKLTESKPEGESVSSSIQDANTNTVSNGDEAKDTEPEKNASFHQKSCPVTMLALLPCAYVCTSHEESSDQQNNEDGMFYCSLCEVEVFKYSKHCRVCDKCVDNFDHHCRWLNNCIGKRNYRKFFALMVSALLLLIFQWSTGILVLLLCLLERKRFASDVSSKLGSSFTLVSFVIVVAACTLLAMIATLPLVQLFFFHILLMKKGISTYDYIIALREQEQQGVEGQQSGQMSPVSSITGLSSTSSFNNFHRAAWCTPPRLFVEDQYDVVPPDNGSVSSLGKKTIYDDQIKKKNPAPVKISPWALARLNGEEVSKAAAEARKKSKILRPIVRRDPSHPFEIDLTGLMPYNRKQVSKRIRLPLDLPNAPLSKMMSQDTSSRIALRQQEARSNFRAMPGSSGIVASSSPESSVSSPGHHPFRLSSLVRPEASQLVADVATQKEIPLSRSTSDGYDASGGEDSDQVPTRMLSRPTNWSNLLFGSEQDRNVPKLMTPSESTFPNHRKI